MFNHTGFFVVFPFSGVHTGIFSFRWERWAVKWTQWKPVH